MLAALAAAQRAEAQQSASRTASRVSMLNTKIGLLSQPPNAPRSCTSLLTRSFSSRLQPRCLEGIRASLAQAEAAMDESARLHAALAHRAAAAAAELAAARTAQLADERERTARRMAALEEAREASKQEVGFSASHTVRRVGARNETV